MIKKLYVVSIVVIILIMVMFISIYLSYKNNKNNNCYSYAFNKIGNYNRKPQPGQFSNMPEIVNKKSYVCKNFIDRVLADNKNSRFISIDSYGKKNVCDSNETSIFLAIDNQNASRDYHFYKKEFGSKYWSHKPGTTQARNYDSSNNKITDPLTADRDYEKKDITNKYKWNYSLPCGYFCNKSN
jgi:hypothetical protein